MVFWTQDRTGRFRERPHYRPEELDQECERTIVDFLGRHRGKIEFPLSTDDLTILIEHHVKDLDLYADLSPEGGDVEGVTQMAIGRRPSIAISEKLSSDDRRANRLRTTLAHELGHAKLHDPVFQAEFASDDLLAQRASRIVCKRETMLDAPQVDWMEWQAGYASGAYLMPRSSVHDLLRPVVTSSGRLPPFHAGEEQATALVSLVASRYAVSREAANVRLIKLGYVTTKPRIPTLFG